MIIELATKYRDGVKWLQACPFDDGQPFYETAVQDLEELYEQMCELATGETRNKIVNAVTDGCFGDDEVEFWDQLIKQLKGE
jgi:hypothetical protein